MLALTLPAAGMEINLAALVILGATIGMLAGFFGVGGGFLLTPMLMILFNMPANFAVGSGLAQIVGLSTAATICHGRHGHVDYRLGALLALGGLPGVEFGAQILDLLKRMGDVAVGGSVLPVSTLVMGVLYVALLSAIGVAVWRESAKAVREGDASSEPTTGMALRLRRLSLRPRIALPASGIEAVSVWGLFVIGFGTGFCVGLLGVGGGFIMMPALIYMVGAPTIVAVGTSLYQILFVSVYGTISHAMKGNVDLLLACSVLMGSAVAVQVGARLVRRIAGARVRQMFSVLLFLVAGALTGKLLFTILG